MAVREYIGARYVPRFTGLYDNTRIYDALDVVDNGSGTSYIARKTVPANTPLTDTDYWFVYGASSGAILDLQSRMSDAETNIDNLEKLVDLSQKHFWYIGDSFLAGAGSMTPWGTYLDALLGKSDTYKTGWGGIGFIATPSGSGNRNLANAILDLTTPPANITDVIVVAGCNDVVSSDVSGFASSVSDFIDAVRTKAGNDVNIIMAFNDTHVDVSYTYYSRACKNKGKLYHLMRQKCFEKKVTFLDSVAYLLEYTSLIGSDGTHPLSEGCEKIAQVISNYIYGGLDQNEEFTVDKGVYKFKVGKKMPSVSIPGTPNLYDDSSNPINIPRGTWFTIGTISDMPIIPTYQAQMTITGVMRLNDGSNNTYVCGNLIITPSGTVQICSPSGVNNCELIQWYGGNPCVIDFFEDRSNF